MELKNLNTVPYNISQIMTMPPVWDVDAWIIKLKAVLSF